jgi:hypothetical protein
LREAAERQFPQFKHSTMLPITAARVRTAALSPVGAFDPETVGGSHLSPTTPLGSRAIDVVTGRTPFSLVVVLPGQLSGASGNSLIDGVNRFTHLEGTTDATGQKRL